MSEPLTIHVWSDYVCPWCYLGMAEIEKVRAKYEVDLVWMPYELRPGAPETGWALPEHIKQKMNQPGNPLQRRAMELGLTLKEREHVPSSRRAHEATEYARAHGKVEPFHAQLLTRYWSKGEDLHDWKTLRSVATDSGLDPDEMEREVSAGTFKPMVDAGVAQAHSLGLNGVPAFVLGGKYLVSGAQEAAVFEEALSELKVPRRPG